MRYLGDLNGGQILKRLIGRTLGLGPEHLAFYDFPDVGDLPAAALAYRDAIDRIGASTAPAPILAEALVAFRLNIDLSNEVRDAAVPAEPV